MLPYFFLILVFLLLEAGLIGVWIACRAVPTFALYRSLSTGLLVWCSTGFVVGNVLLWLVSTGVLFAVQHTTGQSAMLKVALLAIVLVGPIVASVCGTVAGVAVAVRRNARGR